jgi:hypothetical protein
MHTVDAQYVIVSAVPRSRLITLFPKQMAARASRSQMAVAADMQAEPRSAHDFVPYGPLQALIDELEYNVVLSGYFNDRGALFGDEQFRRAIAHGSIATLESSLWRDHQGRRASAGRCDRRRIQDRRRCSTRSRDTGGLLGTRCEPLGCGERGRLDPARNFGRTENDGWQRTGG